MPPRDLRRVLSDAWQKLDDEQKAEVDRWALDAWEAALSATKDQVVKGYQIICKDCGQKRLYDIPVQVPDVLTRVKALEILANQAWGKPPEQKEVVVNVGERTLEALESLPLHELAQLAGVAVDAHDAEFHELPAGE